jgi:hypothetical protein
MAYGKKELKEIIFQMKAEKVMKALGYSDDLEPVVMVKGCANLGEYWETGCEMINGQAIIIKNLIIIRPSEDVETLAHEIAHHVQTIEESETVCFEMFQTNNRGTKGKDIKMAARHKSLTKKILSIIN